MDLGTALRHSTKKNPQKPAVICGDQIVSYEALDRSTDALARWFLRQGLESGDRVAIHWCNSVEVVNLYFGCFKAGLIAVPVNNRLKAPEIAYILQHSQAKMCFSQPELAPLCEEVRAECPELQRLYTALPPLESTDLEGVALPHVSPERVAAILYTSGTTARPKGVMHTHISLTGTTELMIWLGLDETHTVLTMTQYDAHCGFRLRALAGNYLRRNGGFASCLRRCSDPGLDRTLAMHVYADLAGHAAVRGGRTGPQSA